jgi:hypothetical protein
MLGGFVLSESCRSQFFDSAQSVRRCITADFQHVFQSGVRRYPLVQPVLVTVMSALSVHPSINHVSFLSVLATSRYTRC